MDDETDLLVLAASACQRLPMQSTPRTILRKERIHIASQTSYTLYDRLSPTPQVSPPDESSQ